MEMFAPVGSPASSAHRKMRVGNLGGRAEAAERVAPEELAIERAAVVRRPMTGSCSSVRITPGIGVFERIPREPHSPAMCSGSTRHGC
jgi:hypothetical protein